MRHALLSSLLLIACSSGPGVGPDSGVDLSGCFKPADGGVFVEGLEAPVPGCAAPPSSTGELDLAQLGWAREGGLLVVPSGTPPGTPLPVVFVFHGAGKTGEEARARFGLEATTDAGAIFVYPNAIQGTWDIRPASADGRRVDVLIRRLSESYCIDPRRIDIAGFSAGAVFTLYLGCNVPDTFQGMAAVAGSVQRFNQSCCHSTLSALFIHGTEDEAFPITEGQRARDLTLKRDGCGTTPTPEGAHCQDYDCPAPLDVGYCEWDGDHDVPPWAGGEITRFFGL